MRVAERAARHVYGRIKRATANVPAVPARLRPWLAVHRGIRDYVVLDEDTLRRSRRSETVFVFGSGASLNDIPPDEWQRIAEHDTLGFNWFVHERFVRCDYHLIRGIPDTDRDPTVWRPQLEEYFRLIRENPCYADTIFLVQKGFRATNGNRALGFGYLPRGARVFLWRTRDRFEPSFSLADGLSHAHSALHESVNFAFLLGWKQIVLVGVDLYDRRYFWLPREEARTVDLRRGASAGDLHSRTGSGMIETFRQWSEIFVESGVTLSVHNPRSLIAGPLPVYQW
jgi:hypothetical protein